MARSGTQGGKVAALVSQLAEQVSALRSKRGWVAMLRGAARLHRYSVNNQLLIASQAAAHGFTASHVAGFRAWQEHGRAVRKGEKGLAILAPTSHLVPISDGESIDPAQVVQTKKGSRKRVMGYRVTHVWDLAQTDAIDGSDAADASAAGDSAADEPDRAVLERVRSELDRAHRGAAEVQAESVALVLLGAHGIDAGDDGVSYVAGWAGCDDDAVRAAAETVTNAAHALLAEPDSDRENVPPAAQVARATNQALPCGEAATITEARDALHALDTAAHQGHARVETLTASLRAADLDVATLGEVATVLDAADAMVVASGRARAGLSDRHQAMEDAVNATPHAKTSFYRRGGQVGRK